MSGRVRALGILAATLAVVAGAAFVVDLASGADGPRLGLRGATAQLLSDREGRSLLGGANLRPGETVTGAVTLTNAGDEAGAGALALTDVVDVPGPDGVGLLEHLSLTVLDADTDEVLFDGAPAAMPTALALGAFARGAVRRFRVDATVGEGAGQGARASLGLVWTLTGEGTSVTPGGPAPGGDGTPGGDGGGSGEPGTPAAPGAPAPPGGSSSPPAAPAPIPVGPGVSADGRLGLQVRARRTQWRRQGRIAVDVRCARACGVRVTGTVDQRRLRPVAARLRANRWTRLRIRVRPGRARLVVSGSAGTVRGTVAVRVRARR